MSKLLVAVLLSVCCSSLFAQEWEYKVVFLPGSAAGAKVEQEDSGGYLDKTKTKILNELAAKGWVLVSVTGASGADHALYLKREIENES